MIGDFRKSTDERANWEIEDAGILCCRPIGKLDGNLFKYVSERRTRVSTAAFPYISSRPISSESIFLNK